MRIAASRDVFSINSSKHSRYLDRKVTFPDDIPSSVEWVRYSQRKSIECRVYRKASSRIVAQRRSLTLSFSLSHHFALITSRFYLRRALYFKLPLTKLYSSVTNDENTTCLPRPLPAFPFTRYIRCQKFRTPRSMHLFTIHSVILDQ